jgi:hypothetical protein
VGYVAWERGVAGDMEHVDDGDTGPIMCLPVPAVMMAHRPRATAEPEPPDQRTSGSARPNRTSTDSGLITDDRDIAAELERLSHQGEVAALHHFRSALVHPAAVVQIAGAVGLGEHGTPEDVPQLVARLAVAPATARRAIVVALGKLAGAAAVPALIDLVRDPRERVLHADVAEALGRIGARAALPYLDALGAGASTDEATREAAERASAAIRLQRSRETYDPLARLDESLARLDALLGTAAHPDAHDIADPPSALLRLGVTYEGVIPRDLQRWAAWCNRPATDLTWAASRGWHFLSLADALAIRAALQLGGADADSGPWLPIMASEFGDHQVYVPKSYREGVVYSVFHDEPFRPAGPAKTLADHAAAIIDAWTTLQLDAV